MEDMQLLMPQKQIVNLIDFFQNDNPAQELSATKLKSSYMEDLQLLMPEKQCINIIKIDDEHSVNSIEINEKQHFKLIQLDDESIIKIDNTPCLQAQIIETDPQAVNDRLIPHLQAQIIGTDRQAVNDRHIPHTLNQNIQIDLHIESHNHTIIPHQYSLKDHETILYTEENTVGTQTLDEDILALPCLEQVDDEHPLEIIAKIYDEIDFPQKRDTKAETVLIVNEKRQEYQQVKAIALKAKYTAADLIEAQHGDVALLAYCRYCEDPDKKDILALLTHLRNCELDFFYKNKQSLRINKAGVLIHQQAVAVGEIINKPRIVLPQRFRFELLNSAHEKAGHMGEKNTAKRLEKYFIWPGMRADVIQHVGSCIQCQAAKGPNPKMVDPLKPIQARFPNEIVSIDFEQYCESDDGNKGLIVIIDHMTKYSEAYPLKAFNARGAAMAIMNNWIFRYGPMEVLLSDQGPQFEHRMFQDWCEYMDIQKKRGTAYHPQTQGLVERQNKTLTHMLKKHLRFDQRDWDKCLPSLIFSYNCTIHASTGKTPFELWQFKDPPIAPIWWYFTEYGTDTMLDPTEDFTRILRQIPESLQRARHEMGKAQIRQRRNFDRKTRPRKFYRIDEQIMVFIDTAPKRATHKLTPKWRGPFRIASRSKDGRVYTLTNGHRANVTRLKKYHPRITEIRLDESGEKIHWSRWDEPHTIQPSSDARPIEDVIEPEADRMLRIGETTLATEYALRPRGETSRKRDENFIRTTQDSEDTFSSDTDSGKTGFRRRVNPRLRLERLPDEQPVDMYRKLKQAQRAHSAIQHSQTLRTRQPRKTQTIRFTKGALSRMSLEHAYHR